jgi:hypothetical protein
MPEGLQQPPHHSETCSMTTYLLDTNACIALINGNEADDRKY